MKTLTNTHCFIFHLHSPHATSDIHIHIQHTHTNIMDSSLYVLLIQKNGIKYTVSVLHYLQRRSENSWSLDCWESSSLIKMSSLFWVFPFVFPFLLLLFLYIFSMKKKACSSLLSLSQHSSSFIIQVL